MGLLPRSLHGPAGNCSSSVPALRGEGSAGRRGPRLSCGRALATLCRVCPETQQRFPFQFPPKFRFPVPRKSRPAGRAPAPVSGGQRSRNGASPSLSGSRGKGKRREGEAKQKESAKYGKTQHGHLSRPSTAAFGFLSRHCGAEAAAAQPTRPGPAPGPAQRTRVPRGSGSQPWPRWRAWAWWAPSPRGTWCPWTPNLATPRMRRWGRAGGEARAGPVRRGRAAVRAHGCFRRSCPGRRAPGGGDPPAATSAPTSCSGRRRPAGRMPGRRRCGSSAAR